MKHANQLRAPRNRNGGASRSITSSVRPFAVRIFVIFHILRHCRFDIIVFPPAARRRCARSAGDAHVSVGRVFGAAVIDHSSESLSSERGGPTASDCETRRAPKKATDDGIVATAPRKRRRLTGFRTLVDQFIIPIRAVRFRWNCPHASRQVLTRHFCVARNRFPCRARRRGPLSPDRI